MKKLSEIITDVAGNRDNVECSGSNNMLLEMATFGVERWGNNTYRIAVHGTGVNERPNPHIHIYLNTDHNPFTQFNFEISLVDILCNDEINLICQIDRKNNVHNTHRRVCSWAGYKEIRDGLAKFLAAPCKNNRDAHCTDNLERCIYDWNRETDFVKTTQQGINVLGAYFAAENLTPLPKYAKYLADYPSAEE